MKQAVFKQVPRWVFPVLAIYAVGLILQKPQQYIFHSLKSEELLVIDEEKLELDQTTAVVVLGGLRSLVASFLNLSAFGAFEEQDWLELERLYNLIVTLQPKSLYYWETASWHMAYNAYFDTEEDRTLSPSRRRLLKKAYLKKGEDFLLRGVEENPQSVKLRVSLGRLFNDPYKARDFVKAEHYLKSAATLANSTNQTKREYFYTLARTPNKEEEALQYGLALLEDEEQKRFSSIRSIVYSLGIRNSPSLAQKERWLLAVFGSKKAAYRDLFNYWQREAEGFSRKGLKPVLEGLITELNIPDRYNVFNEGRVKRMRKIDY